MLSTRTPLISAAMNHQQSERLELQLILLPSTTPHVFFPSPLVQPPRSPCDDSPPELDLSLSMSIGPPPPSLTEVQALKRQTAEQSRLAEAERACAARVMEMARREVELAEREFARARAVWERARVEVEKMERINKEMAAAAGRRIGLGSAARAVEITCQACMRRFQP